jgi:hypothetical protein
MQGVIYDAMKDYIVGTMGQPVWEQVLARTGRPPSHEYQLEQVYPDAELGLLAGHAAQLSGQPVNDVLEGFGEAIVPMMFTYYGFLADPRWSYVDFLLNMEPLLHAALRLHTPGALPAKIHGRCRPHRAGARDDRLRLPPARLCGGPRHHPRGRGEVRYRGRDS